MPSLTTTTTITVAKTTPVPCKPQSRDYRLRRVQNREGSCDSDQPWIIHCHIYWRLLYKKKTLRLWVVKCLLGWFEANFFCSNLLWTFRGPRWCFFWLKKSCPKCLECRLGSKVIWLTQGQRGFSIFCFSIFSFLELDNRKWANNLKKVFSPRNTMIHLEVVVCSSWPKARKCEHYWNFQSSSPQLISTKKNAERF